MKKKNYRTNVRTDKHGGTIERMENVIARWKGTIDGRIDVRLQVRERIDGGGVVQREQHVREHDRPAFGSLLARAGLPRRFTDQHARIGRWNARLPIRRFVKSCSRSTQTLIPVFFIPWFFPGATILRGTGGIFCLLDFGIEIFKERKIIFREMFGILKFKEKKEERRNV